MKNMRKTNKQFLKKFLNLENKLVENQRQIMYIVENMRLKIRNFLKNEKILNCLIESGLDP